MITEISVATIAHSQCVGEVWLSQDSACYMMLFKPTARLWNLRSQTYYAIVVPCAVLRILDELDQVLDIECCQALRLLDLYSQLQNCEDSIKLHADSPSVDVAEFWRRLACLDLQDGLGPDL